jgi:hypothetical protein
MGSWYWIGVCAGLGVAVGVLLAAVFAGTRIALTAALVLAAGAGVAIGFALGQWDEAIGGGVGGVLGAIGSAQVVAGTMRRGGARIGIAIFFGLAALVLAAIAGSRSPVTSRRPSFRPSAPACVAAHPSAMRGCAPCQGTEAPSCGADFTIGGSASDPSEMTDRHDRTEHDGARKRS